MARLYGAPQLHALFRERCSFAVDWRHRVCHQSLAAGKWCKLAAETARAIPRTSSLAEQFQASGGDRKEGTDVKDDPNDIPMVYLLYVLLAIGGIVAIAAIVIIRIL
jgi:hypothetical protein